VHVHDIADAPLLVITDMVALLKSMFPSYDYVSK
jgi:hypothetical protein